MVKVSVIVPIYNAEQYLKKCLDSIENQTLQELEVICVDDGSIDNSLRVLQEYRKCLNLVVLRQKNAGAGAARNAGLKISKGEFVIFIDPDDYLASDFALEKLYRSAVLNNVMVCGGNVLEDRAGILSCNFPQRRKKSCCFEKNEKIDFSNFQYPFGHQRFLINREFLLKNHIFYPLYRRGQDVVFLARVLICAKCFFAIAEYVHVQRGEHKSVVFTKEKLEDFLFSMYDVLGLAMENNLKELFVIIADEIENFAQKNWYRYLLHSNDWELVDKINGRLIQGINKFGCQDKVNCLMKRDELEKHYYLVKNKKEKTEKEIRMSEHIAIYGTGIWGRKVCGYIKSCGRIPECFVVSQVEVNHKIVEGIKVVGIDELQKKEYLFILGSTEKSTQVEMKENLMKMHYDNILDFDFDILNYFEL